MLIWMAMFFLLSGSLMTLIAALGVLRLPDFYMRMHAATKAGVVGPALVLIGVGCVDPSLSTWIKVILAIIFLLITTPVSSHLLGRAGFVGGVGMWRGTLRNELEPILKSKAFSETVHPHPVDSQTRKPPGAP